MKIIFYIIIILFLALNILAQHVEINLVDTEVYPRIKVYTTVIDANGEVLCNIKPESFRLSESGQKRKIRVYDSKYLDTSIAILLDNSASMDQFIKHVREAARHFLKSMGGTDRACTYVFDHNLQKLCAMLDVSVGKNKTILNKSLNKYKDKGGGTDMYDAIRRLIDEEMRTEKDRRKVIVALTDGVSGGALETALQATSKNFVAVYTIGMGGVDEHALQELSRRSGGKFYRLSDEPTKEELIYVYKDIKNRLNCQYTIIYETPDVCPDGSNVPIRVFVDKYGISCDGTYKRPFDLSRIPLDMFFSPKEQARVLTIPDDPIECETVQFITNIQATSCSDSLVLQDVVVRAYVKKLDDRIEVAKSKPAQIQSNGMSKKVVVEWDTQGFTDEHLIELVIDPVDSVLEINEENNLMTTKLNISKAIHDFFIESIDYSPKPASPCKLVNINVSISDGCTCEGVKTHEIEVEAIDQDREESFGNSIVSVTAGELSVVKFKWDPQHFFGHKPLTFKIDPLQKFGEEQTRENNEMQALIEVSPVLHELAPTEVIRAEKRVFVGDEVQFDVKIEDGGICPGFSLKEKIRVRLKDSKSNRVLTHSDLFTLETQSEIIVPVIWKTNQNDAGEKEFEFTVDAEGKIREQTPPGKTNNTMQYQLEILPMPHDLVILSAKIVPESPADGDPATLYVVVEDRARFPGVGLKDVYLRAYERYTGRPLGKSLPVSMVSQQTNEFQFNIDTGGLAGHREISIKVDPDNLIEELTPEGLDGENNNEFVLKVFIKG